MNTIRVSASFGGKIPTGSYENMNPSYFAEQTIEIEDGLDSLAVIDHMQKQLHQICFKNFEEVADLARIQKIQKDRKDFRFYKLGNEQFISVTSILNYDAMFRCSEDELKQYAAQGTIIDAQVKEYIKTGEWKDIKDIEGIASDIFIIKTGDLHLTLEGWDFPAFLKKHPIENMQIGFPIFNKEYRYAGTPDIIGTFNGLKSILDVKRTPDKIKNMMQMAAYAKCYNDIQQIVIIPLNDKTEQGFSKPISTTEIDKYFELFLDKRREFKKIYNI